MKQKTKKGITLIALIITIAILIIITAVSISAFSDSGLIGKAKNASTKDKIAKLEEELKLEINSNVLKEVIGENTENIENIFKKYAYNGKIQNEDGRRYIQLKENGEKIYISDYNNEGLVTNGADGRWSDTFKINTPKLATGMKAINIDETTGDVTELTEEQYNTWYDYENQRWANAQTTDGSFWVWIPRYEYKINSDKSIDINFISIDKKTPTEEYKIHPAFEDGSATGKNNNFKNGEWDKELSGIWVAKYEMSRSNATIISAGSGTTFKSVPSVISARNISIGNMYTYCQNFDSNVGNANLDSHLMKNSEWGAVAYLTQSKYGRNGTEIHINACSAHITGAGSSSPNAEEYVYDASNFEKDYAYTTENGKNASTTGNITGIYDLSGGAVEYVAGYITNGNGNLSNGSSFVSKTEEDKDGYLSLSTKYATVYPYNSSSDSSENNYKVYRTLSENDSSYGYGDALCETTGWNGDYTDFARSSATFFLRGSSYKRAMNAGVFASNIFYGYADGGDGFRTVLAF